MKTDGRKVDPQGLTSMWFAISVSGWFLLGNLTYSHFYQKNYTEFSKLIGIFIALTSYAVVNYVYSSNDRYLKVYNKYISSADNKSKGKLIFLSFVLMLLPYILIPFVLIYCPIGVSH